MRVRKTLRTMFLGAAVVAFPAGVMDVYAADVPDASAAEASAGSAADATGELDINTSIVVERYSNGRTKTERQVALDADGNFVNHGDFRAFNEEGRLIGAGTFRFGKREGDWAREFHTKESQVISENVTDGFVGPFTSTAKFKDGKLNGEWTITDSKNRPVVSWQFAEDERHGKSTWFNADGSTRKQLEYDKGQITASLIATGSKNELAPVAEYVGGRELVREISRYTKDRKVKSDGLMLKPREVAATRIDWWNGTIETQVVSKEGNRDKHGEWRFWHENGQLEMQGTYDGGREQGRFTWWHENGQRKSEGDYVAGKMQGPWQTWYPNGSRCSAGQFADGERHGIWMSWHDNGMPKMQATYSAGMLLAEARKWDENGRLLSVGGAAIVDNGTQEGIQDDLRVSRKPTDESAASESETR